MYRFADAALLRAAAHPPGWVVTCWPDLDEGTVAQWRDWTRQVWADDHVAAAVAAASPGLAQRLRAVCEGRATDRRRVRRAVASLVAYLLRMQHRATPFGLFAGVAPARVAAAAEVRWGVSHRAAARPDAVWLAEAVQRLEGCSDLLWRLTVVAQDGCVIRGDRLVLPWAPAEPDRPEPAEVGVRHTPAVRTALCTARKPVPFADLAAVLADAHPGVPLGTVRELLGELIRRRFLITSLRPPMTATDPLGHLVAALEDADADTLPAAAPVMAELRAARRPTRLRGVDSDTPPARAVPGSAAELRSEAADLLLDCTLTLPAAVAAEAARAATLLARLSPFPTGSPAWRDYHARFLERYGPGALVRVGDLTDPGTGLGLPAGYRGSPAASPDTRIGARDERLLCWAQHAALTGTREITLDADRLSELAAEPPTQAIPHADVRFHLHAPTRQAVDGGAFSLVVNGISSSAGITAGRFLDLLPAADRQRMTRAYATAPTLDAGAVAVQVSSPPLYPRTERVARAPAMLPRILHLGEHPGADVSAPALRDLAVGADVHRLFLVDLTDGTLVEPRVFNAVEPVNTTHPLVRFLCELPRARAAALAPFSWGAARRLPFLPRIRCGRTVLAQARWRVEAPALPGPTTPAAHWAAALKALRTQTNVPTAVVLGEGDRRLRLDLDNGAHLHLLRTHLDRNGHATLLEAADDDAYGWLDGHAHEITLAVTASHPRPLPPVRPRTAAATGRNHGHLPGAPPWAYAKVYAVPDRHLELLTDHLPDLLGAHGPSPLWWFIRYRDPAPHLRLRIRIDNSTGYAAACHAVATWARNLRDAGLVSRLQWDTYHPETGRYGAGATMTAAESVFAADSQAVLAQAQFTAEHSLPSDAVTAAGLIHLAAAFTGSAATARRWIIRHPAPPPSTESHPSVRDRARALADPEQTLLRTLPGGDRLAAAWRHRACALAAYRVTLAADDGAPDQDGVLSSLLHMHYIRAQGVDEDGERACRRLVRAVALAETADPRVHA